MKSRNFRKARYSSSTSRIAVLGDAQLTRITGGFAPVPGMASGIDGTHLAGIDGTHLPAVAGMRG